MWHSNWCVILTRVVFVTCHDSTKCETIPSLVAASQLQDNECGLMINSADHTKQMYRRVDQQVNVD